MPESISSTAAPEGFRLLQVFLHVNEKSEPEVHEVSVHDDAGLLHCTCTVPKCMHSLSVAESIARNGTFTPRKLRDAPELENREYTAAERRDYILRWHKISVTQ